MDLFSVISWDLGFTRVSAYGLVLTLAALTAGWMWSKVRGDGRLPAVVGFALMVLMGLFFARLVYCLARWDAIFMDPNSGDYLGMRPFFLPQSGGLNTFGALLGIGLALSWLKRIEGDRRTADQAALPAAVFFMLARLAEILSGQGYGDELMESGLDFFPFAVQNAFGGWHYAVFLYEGATLLGVALYLLGRSRKARKTHGDWLRFLTLFAVLHLFFEAMRRDDYLRLASNGFIRLNQVFAMLLLVGLALLLTRKGANKGKTLLWFSLVLATTAVIAVEFYEKLPLSRELLLLVSGALCAGMAAQYLHRIKTIQSPAIESEPTH